MSAARADEALLAAASNGDRAAEDAFIRANFALVRSIAARFAGRGADLEDLVQIGAIGMIKAVRGYDASYGTAFSTYAVPLIAGEIRRFLRDDGPVKVSRDAKKRYAKLLRAKNAYIAANGEEPRFAALCEECGLSEEDALYAMEACGGTVSLEEAFGSEDDRPYDERLADTSLADVTERLALNEALGKLEEKERLLVQLRYYGGLTQAAAASRLGMTQTSVSRSEKRIMEKLKNWLSESNEGA